MEKKFSRRDFLKLSAMTAIGAAIQACAQPEPTPAPAAEPTKAPEQPTSAPEPTSKYKEAPMLAAMVEAGTLPPVDERLPLEPRVVDVVEEIGQYGGTWNRAFIGPSDGSNWGRINRLGLLSWNMIGTEVVPQVAKSWEISGDLKTFTFNLREGMKWSDGADFTTDDVMFWWEDQMMNDEISPAKPSWMRIQGELGDVQRVDASTFKMVFAHAYPLILDWLANREIFTPKHYMKDFHLEYVEDKDAFNKAVTDASYEQWIQYFGFYNNYADNPDRPMVGAWVPNNSTRADTRFVWKRNPYYYSVDPEGNQLPYLDEIVYTFVDDVNVLNLKAASGEIDMQSRHISIDNYPVLMDGREQGDYRLLLWPNSGGADAGLMFNQGYLLNDPAVGEWLANKKFRQALSVALDRDEINEAAFLGLGEPRQLAPPPESPFYPGDEAAHAYTQYDPALANKWLDEIGLDKKDSEGYRLMPNGERLEISIMSVAAFGPWPDVAELAASYWEKVGVKVLSEVVERSLYYERMRANEMQIGVWNTGGAEHTFTYPYWASAYSNGSRIGPVYGLWWTSGGEQGVEPPQGPLHRVMDLHEEGKGVTAEERAALGKEIFEINCEELWTIGTVGLSPMVMGVFVCKNDFRNVPESTANNVIIHTPGNGFPEQFFWKN